MGERERIELLRRVFAVSDPHVLLGVGDDAALLDSRTLGTALVTSVDAMVEHVHFRRSWLSFAELGYRATMAAASDLAAMGAEPRALLSALVLPADVTDADLEELAGGQREAGQSLGLAIVGGNLAGGATLTITSTVLGACRHRGLRRDGARAGDALYISGALGMAALGLRALYLSRPGERIDRSDASMDASLGLALTDMRYANDVKACIDRWRRPYAQIDAGIRVCDLANAAIDLSDGLSLDLDRLAEASAVAVEIDADCIMSEQLQRAAAALGTSALDAALGGGEDYALLIALSPKAVPPAGFQQIGRFFSMRDDPPAGQCENTPKGRLWLNEKGARRPIKPLGYDHFSST